MASYQTKKALSEGFYKEKGSKFLAFAVPVASEAAMIIEKEEEIELDISFAYEKIHLVMDLLKRERVQIISHDLSEKCKLSFRISKSEMEKILSLLAPLTY